MGPEVTPLPSHAHPCSGAILESFVGKFVGKKKPRRWPGLFALGSSSVRARLQFGVAGARARDRDEPDNSDIGPGWHR